MRKLYLLAACILLLCAVSLVSCHSHRAALPDENSISEREEEREEGEENEEYDGPEQRAELEFEKTKDPALGYVPYQRLFTAMEYTESLKHSANTRPMANLLWIERGPIYDSLGPSNGNGRGGGGYTSGRMAGVLIDTLNDPTGNTVFCGGVAGGLWKCSNFMAAIPNWQVVNDFFDNLAVFSICQDPTNPSIMYFTTGEATSNADAVLGGGIWKSVDKGNTWSRLPSTVNFIRSFKIMCDAAGNVYLAARTTTTPVAQPFALMRSKDKGATWTNITPTGLTSNNICSDIEISSTGRLHASFGYTTAGGQVNHRYTTDPANVTTTTGWNTSTGIRSTGVVAVRLELACVADTLYGVTVNTAHNADSCYKSIDGGATWTKQNTNAYPTGVLNGQGWYNITLSVNPANTAEFIIGGLDAYRSVNSGVTASSRITFWVTTVPYVHADHHFMQWWKLNTGESRVVIGCDGGIFLSRDGGVSWIDKNRNLGIKQFYAADIHPDAGSDYLIAGAQDNGCHQLKNAGLSYSFEVTGGDGCFVHINQQNPQVQFGSYVYNQYRRSLNGGITWASVNLTTASQGMFVNPFTLDDSKNILYGCWASNQVVRWTNAGVNATPVTSLITFTGFGTPASFKVSPYTADRLFIGSSSGRIFRLDHADVATAASFPTDLKDIGGAFPAGFINCVNVGSTDDVLVATMTNYGINNVWYSTNGGTSWTAIDGNLPDMPVRWALFKPGHDDQLILATEAGIYTTEQVNGSSTVWSPNPGYPTVRTDMLKMRTSDNTIVAATHGRGLWTAIIPTSTAPEIAFISATTPVSELTVGTINCRGYKDYLVNVGSLNPPTGNATITYAVQAGNTAKRGVDFDFTANGDFTNPSSQHVFTSGIVEVKPLTVRIYDDAEVEPAESFTINFTIGAGTNAVAGTQKTHTFTITDNENAAKPISAVSYNLGTFNADMDNLNTPFDGNKLKHRLQVLFTAGELRAAGIYASASISSLKLRVKTKNTTVPFKGFTISMTNTATSTLSTGFTGGTFTTVYTGDYSTVAGDNVFNFTTAFAWDGISNVAIQFCFDNSSLTAAENKVDVVEGNSVPLGTGVRASTYSNHTTSTAAGCSLGAAFIDDFRLNATLTAAFGNKVATALNTARTEYLAADNDLYYYSPAGEILARIRNLSAHDYGCTNVVIDRAGTSTKQFWNTTPANYLMDKTFRIIPTTNNATGKYEVTLYYTKAEKEGWEAATGQSWNNIQLVKIPSAISSVTVANPQPDLPRTIEVVTPVRGTFGDDFTLTYTFETGFSGFGAGIPGRVKTDLILSGILDAGGSSVLTWTTNAEVNSTSFELEKSYDGITYTRIATVNASGTKYTPSSYTSTDKDNKQMLYYRVRMLHSDGFVIVSNYVLVINNGAPFRMFVIPNPFEGDMIRVQFARIPTGSVKFVLYDGAGRQITSYMAGARNNNSPYYAFPVRGTTSRAIYMLEVLADGKRFAVRVMKK
jgi:trimeric autotransporter adhesin